MIHILNGIFGIVFSLLEAIIKTLGEGVVSCIPTRRKQSYDADFAEPQTILRKNGSGFHIGEWSNSLTESHNHMIVFGGSGSHKSTSIVYRTLLESNDASMIVNDPAKELYPKTSEAKYRNGYSEILVLDINNPQASEGFNVLAYVKTFNDADRVANILIRNTLDGSSYDYWAQSAENTIAFFIKVNVTYAPPEYRNLYNVLHMLRVFSYSPKLIDAWLVKNAVSVQLMTEYKGIIVTPEKTLQSTLATAKNALAIYGSPNVAQVTSFNTINAESFLREKKILYICSSASDAFLYRSITSTLFESFFSAILRTKPYDKNQIPIMFLIDEAANMRVSLSQALSLTRKHSTSICTLWQDMNQIESIYGKNEAANIYANSGLKVFMPSGTPLPTATMLSQLLGKFEYIADSETGVTKTRELLTAQEIYQLKKILALSGNNPPMLLDKFPFYEDKKLLKLSQLPPYSLPNKLPFEAPPLLQFE